MASSRPPELLITGLGVTSAIGQGKSDFTSALLAGRHAFGVMQRPGRQKGTSFLGAEVPSLSLPERFTKRLLRTLSFSGQVALATLQEAWDEAQLSTVDPSRIGLVVGGSNLQQRELLQTHESYGDQLDFLRPTYGLSFLDSDLSGLCTEQFGIRGFGYTIGGASASGQLAVLQAAEAVRSGQVDVCLAMGGLMDLSYMELQGLRALGAMGSDRYADDPTRACRPFDKGRDGFIYGEGCGVIVIERAEQAIQRQVRPYASVVGWGLAMDANRNPNPSCEGEVRVIRQALERAGLSPEEIDYINPHGTGSRIGDETELQALRECGLLAARINATKSITGHGLTAAGAVEIVATLLQMRASQLHPTRNLEDPMDVEFNWVRGEAEPHDMHRALSLSMGFGGVNTAICLQRV
ncbi:beta-ketoacyl synthase N-terminal-like domain-containing protein [Paenibacillus maysiensis]|uniref:beta-ketoacyl synthase N-terminal-like domain-containing protein n=1 Tax=Paenibacillus maysiensis TaxID=1155954 RepID=UPI0004728304|nr:beta-ketoacyl synthase N-terminal-like domain-containing protein [Paenibacillus maysiensis]